MKHAGHFIGDSIKKNSLLSELFFFLINDLVVNLSYDLEEIFLMAHGCQPVL